MRPHPDFNCCGHRPDQCWSRAWLRWCEQCEDMHCKRRATFNTHDNQPDPWAA